MNAGHKWIIVLVAYDDPEIEAQVIKERLPVEDNEQLAALLRGGELVAVIDCDNESAAESERVEVEKSSLR
jgi:hypothetical protein